MAALLLSLLAALASAGPAGSVTVLSVSDGRLRAGGKAVKPGSVLRDGAAVTLDRGQAVLDFGGEGKLLLKGPAELVLGGRRLSLRSGGLLSVLPRLSGRFTVATASAVAAVRGTDFFIEARRDGSTYLCVCRGAVEVSGPSGVRHRETIMSDRHEAAVFTRAGKRLKRSPAAMEHHGDEDIAALKAR